MQKAVLILLIASLSMAGLYVAAPFLIPPTLAAIISMVFVRLSNVFEARGMSRALAALVCVLLLITVAGLIIFLLSLQLSSLAEDMDAMKSRLMDMLESLKTWINQTVGIKKAEQQKMIEEQSKGQSGTMLTAFASGVFSVAVDTILVLVYIFLFLSMRGHFKKFILKLVPKKENEDTAEVIHNAGKVSQKYLSGLAAMIGILWLMYSVAFSIVGVEYAIFFAVLCGLLEIVPFIGNLTGTTITVLAVIAQGGDGGIVIGVIVTYLLVQFLQTYILEPLVVGEQVNINPMFTIMGIVLGMILAIPLMGMAKIICDAYTPLKPLGYLIGPENPRKPRTTIIDFFKSKLRAKG